MPDKKQLRTKRTHFGSQFERIQSMMLGKDGWGQSTSTVREQTEAGGEVRSTFHPSHFLQQGSTFWRLYSLSKTVPSPGEASDQQMSPRGTFLTQPATGWNSIYWDFQERIHSTLHLLLMRIYPKCITTTHPVNVPSHSQMPAHYVPKGWGKGGQGHVVDEAEPILVYKPARLRGSVTGLHDPMKVLHWEPRSLVWEAGSTATPGSYSRQQAPYLSLCHRMELF